MSQSSFGPTISSHSPSQHTHTSSASVATTISAPGTNDHLQLGIAHWEDGEDTLEPDTRFEFIAKSDLQTLLNSKLLKSQRSIGVLKHFKIHSIAFVHYLSPPTDALSIFLPRTLHALFQTQTYLDADTMRSIAYIDRMIAWRVREIYSLGQALVAKPRVQKTSGKHHHYHQQGQGRDPRDMATEWRDWEARRRALENDVLVLRDVKAGFEAWAGR